MPAPVIKGLIDYISQELDVVCWDGEIPRYSTTGTPINPDAVTSPTTWPVVKVYMQEGGFVRTWNMGSDPYSDDGEILIQVWGTGRQQVQTMIDRIETLMVQATNWGNVILAGDHSNPQYLIQFLLTRWYIGQEEGERTARSEFLYRGELYWDCMIHGAIPSQ